jgi:CRISPR/Cas system-associated protein Cas7 (RAMP superfamily)
MEDKCGRDQDVIREKYMQAKEVDRRIEKYLKAIPELANKELKTSMKNQRDPFISPYDHFIPPMAPAKPPPTQTPK